MNAALYFGQNYREATRRRGEDEGRRTRMGMRTLADQAGDEEEPGQKIRFRCPECEQMVTMRKMLARVGADENEEEAGERRLAVRCAKCNEEIELEAPAGRRWVSRGSEASVAFGQRYHRALRERGVRHSNVSAAMRIR